jgi:hypothetical protein
MITSKKSNKKERFANHRLATSLLKRKTMLPLSGSVTWDMICKFQGF